MRTVSEARRWTPRPGTGRGARRCGGRPWSRADGYVTRRASRAGAAGRGPAVAPAVGRSVTEEGRPAGRTPADRPSTSCTTRAAAPRAASPADGGGSQPAAAPRPQGTPPAPVSSWSTVRRQPGIRPRYIPPRTTASGSNRFTAPDTTRPSIRPPASPAATTARASPACARRVQLQRRPAHSAAGLLDPRRPQQRRLAQAYCSRQPREPHRTAGLAESTTTCPISPANPWAPRSSSAVQDQGSAHPDLARQVQERPDRVESAEPQLRQGREIRLVLRAHRQLRVAVCAARAPARTVTPPGPGSIPGSVPGVPSRPETRPGSASVTPTG